MSNVTPENSDTYPLDDAEEVALASGKERGNLATLAALLGCPGLGSLGALLYHPKPSHGAAPRQPPLLMGAGLGLLVGLLWLFFRALRDTYVLRASYQAQGLIEDAWTQHALGQGERSEQSLKEAFAIAKRKLGHRSLVTLAAVHSLANLYRVRGQLTEATPLYDLADRLYRLAFPQGSPSRANFYRHVALSWELQKKLDEAAASARASLAMWQALTGPRSLATAQALVFAGRFAMMMDHNEVALDHFSRALEIQKAALSPKDPDLLSTMDLLSRVYIKMRLFRESEPFLYQLVLELEESSRPDYPMLVEAHLNLAVVRFHSGKGEHSEHHLVRGLHILQQFVGPNERLLEKVLDGYKLLADSGHATGARGVSNLIVLFQGERDQIRLILERDPGWVNARDATGWGPLQWSIFIGRDDVLRWLLARGADPAYDSDTTMGPVHVACAWNRREALLELLSKGVEPNSRGPNGWTPVFWCCRTGRVKMVELLLKSDARVGLYDDDGQTPLHIAADQNHLPVVAALLGAGASVNARDKKHQRTPLMLAAARGHLAVCECLVFNRAELGLKDDQGRTALQLAQIGRHRLLVRALRNHLNAGLGKAARKRKGAILEAAAGG